MKKILLPVALAALCGLAGCLPTSINPLYTDKDLAFDPALVGVWSDKDDSKETWTFEKAGEKSYKFLYTESDGRTGLFKARLLNIGDAPVRILRTHAARRLLLGLLFASRDAGCSMKRMSVK